MVEVEVKSIDIQPNECEIDQPLDLKITFVPDGDVANASWEFKYVVDYASSRKILMLDTSSVSAPYKANEEATYEVHVDSLNLSGFKRSDVLNVGLLAAVLKSGEEEVIQINMVTQVMEVEGKLTRNIMSPLE